MVPSLGAKPFPPPLAKYEEVVASTTLFMRTLEKLHIMMGTKFMVPTIGGKELDLHRLFVEVTYRGGLEKVIKERKWKEITAVFNFPSTATNASFILRKYYFSLMHHYEQIYFFRAQSWTAPEQTTPTASPAQGSAHSVDPLTRSLIQGGAIQRGRKSSDEVLPRANTPITGFIDGKFDHGYLVTVKVGTQRLRGVLYHTTAYPETGIPRDSGIVYNGNKDAATSGSRRRRRKKSEMRKRDPYHPKPNRSGYNFFFAEQHARLKLLHSGKDREISRMIGELWNKLTETEKAVYQDRGVKDKERYQSEMEEYRERLKMVPIISNAVPIQQRLLEPDLEMVDADSRTETEGGCLPLGLENGSSSSESDSEEITPDNNFEWEKFPEIGSVTETSKIVTEVSMGGAGFEQQRRNSVDMDINVPGASSGNDSELMEKDPATESESMKKDPATEMDSSNVPGASSGNESELMKTDPATESESMKKDPSAEMDSSNVPGASSGNESELMKEDPATGIDSSNVPGASSGNESELMKKDPATGIDSSNVSGASLGEDSELMKKDPATESESMKKDPATVMDSSNVLGASLGNESESMKKHPATEMDSSNVPVASLGDKPELMMQDPATDSESMKEDPSTDRH